MQRKTLMALNFLRKVFRGSLFVFLKKSCLLKIDCLFILIKKYLVQELPLRRGVGACPSRGTYTINYG